MFFGTARHTTRHLFSGNSILAFDTSVNDGNFPFDSIYFFQATAGAIASWELYKPGWINYESSSVQVDMNSGTKNTTYFSIDAGTYTSKVTGTISGQEADAIALYEITGGSEPYSLNELFHSDSLASAGSPPATQTLTLDMENTFTLGTSSKLVWGCPGNTATVVDIDIQWQLVKS